jgi:hypothetical protein
MNKTRSVLRVNHSKPSEIHNTGLLPQKDPPSSLTLHKKTAVRTMKTLSKGRIPSFYVFTNQTESEYQTTTKMSQSVDFLSNQEKQFLSQSRCSYRQTLFHTHLLSTPAA